jgi:hypothetical protein
MHYHSRLTAFLLASGLATSISAAVPQKTEQPASGESYGGSSSAPNQPSNPYDHTPYQTYAETYAWAFSDSYAGTASLAYDPNAPRVQGLSTQEIEDFLGIPRRKPGDMPNYYDSSETYDDWSVEGGQWGPDSLFEIYNPTRSGEIHRMTIGSRVYEWGCFYGEGGNGTTYVGYYPTTEMIQTEFVWVDSYTSSAPG